MNWKKPAIEYALRVPGEFETTALLIIGNFFLHPLFMVSFLLVCANFSFINCLGFSAALFIGIFLRRSVRNSFSIYKMKSLSDSLYLNPNLKLKIYRLEQYLSKTQQEELEDVLKWGKKFSGGILGNAPVMALYAENITHAVAAYHFPGGGQILNSFVIILRRPEEINPASRFLLLHEAGHVKWENMLIQASPNVLRIEFYLILLWIFISIQLSIINVIIVILGGILLKYCWKSFWPLTTSPQILDEFAADSFAIRYLSIEERAVTKELLTRYKFFDKLTLSLKENQLRHERRLMLLDMNMPKAEEHVQLMLPSLMSTLVISSMYFGVLLLPLRDLTWIHAIFFIVLSALFFMADKGVEMRYNDQERHLAQMLSLLIKETNEEETPLSEKTS